ncbi:hypothetical protein PFISCL1PPCAC_18323, partial [Pristionchus fissidentatus]
SCSAAQPHGVTMFPNYNYGNVPSGSGGGYPYMQQPQLPLPTMPPMMPPVAAPVVPPAFHDDFTTWAQWNHFNGVNPTESWRHQASVSVRQTPYDRPVVAQHQVPYGGRPYVPRDLSGPNANTMRGAPVPHAINKQNSHDAFYNNVVPTLDFDVHVSSTKLDVVWKAPHVSGQLTYEVSVAEGKNFPFSLEFPANHTKYSIRAKAGESYQVSITAKKIANGVIVARGQRTIKAIFSDAELQLLYEKAVKYTGTRMHPFEILYRCKPKPYWDDIHHNCRNVMERYMKDDNGQPANSINGVISGLFFSARLLPNGTLPCSSPFGNVRMLVQAFMLLDPENVNIYFADFYCNKQAHYVTIVVAVKGGETDNYASKCLIPLDMRNNPWLKYLIRPDGDKWKFLFYAACSVWVEILFTENVPLNWGRFDQIQATGLGTSKIGGLSNNKSCTTCNLYPPGAGAARAADATHAYDAAERRADDYDARRRSDSTAALADNDERVEPPQFESLPSEEDGYEAEEGELPTAYETGANSTFQTLINCHNVNDYPNWTDLIECVCEVVDGVVMMEQQDRDRRITDFTTASDARIASALDEMDSVVGSCDEDKIHDLAGDMHELAGWWQRARDELAKLCDEREARARDNRAAAAASAVAAAAAAAAAQAPPTSGKRKHLKQEEEDMDEYLEDDEAKASKSRDAVITTQQPPPMKTAAVVFAAQSRVNLTPSAMRPTPAAAPPPFVIAVPAAAAAAARPPTTTVSPMVLSIPLPPEVAVKEVKKEEMETPTRSKRKERGKPPRQKKQEEVMDEYLDDDDEVTVAPVQKAATVLPAPTPPQTTPKVTVVEKKEVATVPAAPLPEKPKDTVAAKQPTATVPLPDSTTADGVTVKEEEDVLDDSAIDLSLFDETCNASMWQQQQKPAVSTVVGGGSRTDVLQRLQQLQQPSSSAAAASKSLEGEDEWLEEDDEDTVDLKRSINEPIAVASTSFEAPKRVKLEELDEHEEELLLALPGSASSSVLLDITQEMEDELLGID